MSACHVLPWGSWGFDSTGGTSDCATFVWEQAGKAYKDLTEAPSLQDGRDTVLEEIDAEAASCAEPGWDGYGAAAVAPCTVQNAQAFVEALPRGVPMPSVSAEPDGHLTLEWYRSPNWVVSVSISPESYLYYAAMLGTARARGKEAFLGPVPESILQIVERFHRK